eukprot:TRINITY_DN609_c0_g6_i1.p1 TRINITY_DN609_c0_g6~~TRINITY_DN609_c0_g6_i1.p1  ORF type:complete len:352 (+),score=157.32 TRINITY_DN609_c0_g6_i1:73-1056(+)
MAENKDGKKKVRNIQKEGLLHFKKSNKKWAESQNWFVLTGGGLYYYKHPQDLKPSGLFALDKTTTIEEDGNSGKSHTIVLTIEGEKFGLAADDATELGHWKEQLKASIGKEVLPPPEKEEAAGGTGILFRMQKNVVSMAVTSSLGKKVMKQMLPKEFNDTLEDIRIVVEKKAGAKQAKELQNVITKLLVKAFFQVDRNNLTVEDFQVVLLPLDEALELLSVVTANYSTATPEQLSKSFSKAEEMIRVVEKEVLKLMLPYMKPKNQAKIKEALEFLANAKFLSEVWADEKLREEQLKELCLLYKSFTPKKMRRKTTAWREIFPRKEGS